MVNVKKCVNYNKNCGGMLKRSAQIERESHHGSSICSGYFTNGLVRRGLAESPITTAELDELLAAL